MDLQHLWLLMERQNKERLNMPKHLTGVTHSLITSLLTTSKLLTTGSMYDSSLQDSLSATKQPPSKVLDQNDLNT